MSIHIGQAYDLVMDVLKAHLVPLLLGPPGLGKSDITKEIAAKNNLLRIDMRLSQTEPVELQGVLTDRGDRARYLPLETLPLEPIGDEKDPLEGTGYDGYLLDLDEMTNADRPTLAAAYKLVLDRMVGQRKLHKRLLIVASGNRTQDNALATRMGTAMQSRLITFEIEPNLPAWQAWAIQNGIDNRIRSFLEFKPDMLHKFDPHHDDHTFPCPRTWAFLSRLIKPYKDSIPLEKIALCEGAVGQAAGRMFRGYSEVYEDLPTIRDILKDPEHCRLGDEPSVHYALSGVVSHHMDMKNCEKLMKFLCRLGKDLQFITLRACIAKDINLLDHDAVKDWRKDNAKQQSKLFNR